LSGLVTVGELARAAGDAAVTHGLPRAQWTACSTPEAAAHTLRPTLSHGDAVLVKGSHGVHLEECCELLVTRT
jgi:UDP-N-acetylmuramyl pentapeptide synthase